MGHVVVSRFRYHPDHGSSHTHGQAQALASANSKVKGVVSSRTFLAHDQVILWTEIDDWGTLDRIAANADVKKARREVFAGDYPESAGTEMWSGNSMQLLED